MYKKALSILSILSISLAANATDVNSKSPMAIIPGDYADPSVLRDGEDFYMTHSPFLYKPGFLIWHSRDLSTWEPVTRALADWDGSAMAPDLVKQNGKYYIYFPSAGTVFVTVADDIRGPWSEPVDLHISGIDPGHIADVDGNRYLYVNEGEMVKLAPDGLSKLTEKVKTYDGWDIPADWITEGKYLESPKLFYKDGYFYMVSAEGGTAGPATSHMVIAARSKSPEGPWENSPYNPTVHTYSDAEAWWSKGHGTLVDDLQGNWWVVYHSYANDNYPMGRQTLIEPVEWTADGWFKGVDSPRYLLDTKTAEISLSDDFSGKTLGWQWTMWREYAPDMARLQNGELILTAKGDTPAKANLLLTTAMHANYVVEADFEVNSDARGGLLLFYSDKAYAGLIADDENIYVYTDKDSYVTMPNAYGRKLDIKIENQYNKLAIYVKGSNGTWQQVAAGIDASRMNHNVHGGFFALRPALVAQGEGSVNFFDFKYLPEK